MCGFRMQPSAKACDGRTKEDSTTLDAFSRSGAALSQNGRMKKRTCGRWIHGGHTEIEARRTGGAARGRLGARRGAMPPRSAARGRPEGSPDPPRRSTTRTALPPAKPPPSACPQAARTGSPAPRCTDAAKSANVPDQRFPRPPPLRSGPACRPWQRCSQE